MRLHQNEPTDQAEGTWLNVWLHPLPVVALHKRYGPKPLRDRLQQLLTDRNESLRQAGLRSDLDHQVVRRIMTSDQRPALHTCVLLADHFGVNPNEFLELAGHPRLNVFDVRSVTTGQLPTEVVDVALDLARIPNPGTRREHDRAAGAGR